MQLSEGRPLLRILFPALEHHGVKGVCTKAVRRLGHAIIVVLNFVNDLSIVHACIRSGASRYKLIQEDAERPHVRLDGVGAQARVRINRENFGRGPSYFLFCEIKQLMLLM